jgi:hypothetical protein
VGVERSVVLEIGAGANRHLVRSVPEEEHQTQLTREEVTSAVHYVRFPFTPAEVAAFGAGPVTLLIDHTGYPDGLPGALLSDATRSELSRDLAGE